MLPTALGNLAQQDSREQSTFAGRLSDLSIVTGHSDRCVFSPRCCKRAVAGQFVRDNRSKRDKRDLFDTSVKFVSFWRSKLRLPWFWALDAVLHSAPIFTT